MGGVQEIPSLIQRLYSIVEELERHFPDRRFTPDGHLVGSIGEVLAAHYYDLELLPSGTETHDARAPDGTLVQVKATQRGAVGIRSEPQHLLVLRILPDGRTEEVYNGPGKLAWDHAGRLQKNGQRPIALSKLEALMQNVGEDDQLPRQVT